MDDEIPENTRHVTSFNIEDVAKWCGGELLTRDDSSRNRLHIRIGDDSIAFIGDWIVKGSGGVDVLSHETYMRFPPKARRDPEKFSAILKVVRRAMLEMDTPAYRTVNRDMRLVAETAALEILALDDLHNGS